MAEQMWQTSGKKAVKQNTFMHKVIQFENEDTQTVDTFNKIFDVRLPFDVDFELEIGEPIATDGRLLIINRSIKHNFIDVPCSIEEKKYCFKALFFRGKFLTLFRSPRDLSRIIDIDFNTAVCALTRSMVMPKGYYVLDLYEKESETCIR